MSPTVLLALTIVLLSLSSAGGYDGPRSAQRKQINSVVGFISEIQLYQRKKSRAIIFLPCPPGKVRSLQGKCRTAHKEKIPNTLFRLNQFLKIRKKHEKKRTNSGTLNKTDKVVSKTTNNNIEESLKENVEYQQDQIQDENVPVETMTNVVFLDLSNKTNPAITTGENEVKQDTTTMMTNYLEEESEGSGSEVVTDLISIVETETVTDLPDQEDQESSTVADSFYDENSLEYQLGRSEGFLIHHVEIMGNVVETSGDMESLEVNVPFP